MATCRRAGRPLHTNRSMRRVFGGNLPCIHPENGVFLMRDSIVLSYIQVKDILAAREKGEQTAEVSPDLGLSTGTATITPEGVVFGSPPLNGESSQSGCAG